MAASQFNGTPTPNGSNTVAFAADLKSMSDSIDPRLNLLAKNESDRNTRFANVPAGTIVSTPDGWQWMKITDPPAAPNWITLFSVETYTGFDWTDSGQFSDNGNSKITKIGPNFHCFIGCTYNGAANIGDSDGIFADIHICVIGDSDFRPISGTSEVYSVIGGSSFAGNGICYGSSGTINLSNGYPGMTLTQGTSLNLNFSFMVPGA